MDGWLGLGWLDGFVRGGYFGSIDRRSSNDYILLLLLLLLGKGKLYTRKKNYEATTTGPE